MNTSYFINNGYDPAPESAPYSLEKEYGHFINGKFVKSSSKKTFITKSPATGKQLARVADASAKDVDKAVTAAGDCYDNVWSKLPAIERGKYLFRLARLIQEHARELAVIESLDGGKPIRESRDADIPLVAAYFFYYAGWADKLEYAFPGRKPKSLGVVGQIIPWNFPLLMLAWKIAPALACGNTVVLKSAEFTPLTALKFAELVQMAGFPEGAVNIISGGPEAGKAIVDHKGIQKIAFTGSTVVGKSIQKQLAGTDVKYTLELGGKAAHIVFEDATIDQAVEGVVNGIFFNQGHVCCAGSRLLVQEGIRDVFVKKLKRRMETLVVGDPLDKNTDVGAINNSEQMKKIKRLVSDAEKSGLEVHQSSAALPEKGFWYPPTLVCDVPQSAAIVQEEIFGPVLSIQTFRTPDEAITKANNTPYGLSGGVWTSSGAKIFKVTSSLKSCLPLANHYNKFDSTSPFGGYKESGVGREGGLHGLAPYLNLKQGTK